MNEIYKSATDVSVKDGQVHLDGPDGVDVTMTPEAAVETSDRLLEAALKANGEQVENERKAKAKRDPGP